MPEIAFTVKYTLDGEFTPEQLQYIEVFALHTLREWIGVQNEAFHDNFVLDIDFDPPEGLFPDYDALGDERPVSLSAAVTGESILEAFISQLEEEIGKRNGELP